MLGSWAWHTRNFKAAICSTVEVAMYTIPSNFPAIIIVVIVKSPANFREVCKMLLDLYYTDKLINQ